MSIPTLELSSSPVSESSADVLVVFATSADDGPALVAATEADWVVGQLSALGASGSAEELTRLPGREGGARVVLVAGVGERADAPSLRLAAGAALRGLNDAPRVALDLAGLPAEAVAAALEGASLGAYRYNEYRSEPKLGAELITAHTGHSAESVGVDRVRVVAEAVARTRDLVNASPAELFPEAFADRAVQLAGDAGLEVRVWDDAALRADGFGGLVGVGQGSSRGPRLVRIEHAPEGATFTLALVGKGITFDSGGLSLKPGASMVGMKGDMAGAAAVLETIVALARLDVPVRVVGWLCLAENLPSGTALRPNDVLRIHGGKTVEVLNTDAEGRLVMADALDAASAEQPDAIIDVATLTGAQIVALGHRISGLMGDTGLVEQISRAAEAVDEAVWPMPLPDHLRPLLKSEVADLVNTKLGTVVPGMLLAGVFLREFVGRDANDTRIPWAHLDIAGPADHTGGGWGFTVPGATGVAVRTLVRLGEDLAAR
ncbi:leucyl aminopeptidase [Agromyces aerolatus]|uniref:leucyl aminopeptidase n=1 Tax=Agromyces sp. LY-1074 TaxID=3074080 RepID=UPI0028570396|nr:MULTISPECIES: leucyl aminopeptidase [unclassified Agromyces]MDR5700141.1 leucyl aminopeptidase [Agromyces sp. LY-1074]MDR5706491.1 leucyl aminopeptidase [Agromyces sp. LY-1358]